MCCHEHVGNDTPAIIADVKRAEDERDRAVGERIMADAAIRSKDERIEELKSQLEAAQRRLP